MVLEYSDDDRIMIVENFDEQNQPYSCTQWGDFAEENIPMIFTDGTPTWDFLLWDMFSLNCSAGTIVIDHNMRIRYVLDYFPSYDLNNDIIPELLLELESSRPDVNNDEIINVLDVIFLANMIINDDINWIGDVNQDDNINILDIMMIINVIIS